MTSSGFWFVASNLSSSQVIILYIIRADAISILVHFIVFKSSCISFHSFTCSRFDESLLEMRWEFSDFISNARCLLFHCHFGSLWKPRNILIAFISRVSVFLGAVKIARFLGFYQFVRWSRFFVTRFIVFVIRNVALIWSWIYASVKFRDVAIYIAICTVLQRYHCYLLCLNEKSFLVLCCKLLSVCFGKDSNPF